VTPTGLCVIILFTITDKSVFSFCRVSYIWSTACIFWWQPNNSWSGGSYFWNEKRPKSEMSVGMVSFASSLLQMWEGVHMENKPFETFEIRMWKETSLPVSILSIHHQS